MRALETNQVSHVLVAVPAHEEATEIGRCLEHVVRAARLASQHGIEVSVAVAAHRCTDETQARAERVLTDAGARHLVVDDEASGTVGEVRARLVDEACRAWQLPPATTWLFNTDADSQVLPPWITQTLQFADARGASAVAGMVELHGWSAPPDVRATYASLIEAGVSDDGHTHVYGANLAVRLDAYLAVGGFASVHAEDQDLIDRLKATTNNEVAALLASLVRTSARRPGRAAHGLGALLERLDREATLLKGPPRPGAQKTAVCASSAPLAGCVRPSVPHAEVQAPARSAAGRNPG